MLVTRQPVVQTYFREQFLQGRIFAPVQTCACELSQIEQDSTSNDAGFRPADEGTYTPAAFPNQGGAPSSSIQLRPSEGGALAHCVEGVSAFDPFGRQPASINFHSTQQFAAAVGGIGMNVIQPLHMSHFPMGTVSLRMGE